jgi:putative aldouronate transport system substrate-binding protein
MKGIVRIFVFFVMTWFFFAGCSKQAQGTRSSSSVSDTPAKLSVMVYDRGNMPASYGSPIDNQWTRYIKEHFAVPNNIDLTYIAVPRTQDGDKINVMMASKSAPDIIFTYTLPLYYNYAMQGGLTDLKPLIHDNAPDLERMWGEEVLKYGRYQGHQYAIYAKRALVDQIGSFIRKDWLDKIGFKLGTYNGHYAISTDDLFDVLSKFKSQNAGGVGAANTFPWGAYGTGDDTEMGCAFYNLQMAFFDKDTLTEDFLATKPLFLWPGAKDGFRYINKLYNAGLFDPDFALQKDDTIFWARITNGQTGFWSHDSWKGLYGTAGDNFVSVLYDADPNAEVVAIEIINSQTGKPSYRERYPPTGMTIMVPAFSKVPDVALQYLNWLSILENDFVLRYGFEGEHYNLVDGFPVVIDRDYNAKTRMNLGDLQLPYNGDPIIENALANIRNTFPERTIQIRLDQYPIATENSYVPYDFGQPIDSEIKYASNLQAKADEIYVQSIMAKPENFDATYDRLVAEYLRIGGQEIIDEKTKVYNTKY